MIARVLLVIGLLMVAAGALWALQGAGIVMWPAESFMLRREGWITYGLGTMLAGVFLIGWARRRR
ncbi:MAG: hypothetical protein JNJ92_11445 [Altererythrobacter sp.]|nr:hypothetical protein [Altererythrobacter sp.]